MKKILKGILHFLMMSFSANYARNFQLEEGLKRLQEEVDHCHHSTADMPKLRKILASLAPINSQGLARAAKILADGNNFECKHYAVELIPSFGKYCGDQVMEAAREHLKLYGHHDRAT